MAVAAPDVGAQLSDAVTIDGRGKMGSLVGASEEVRSGGIGMENLLMEYAVASLFLINMMIDSPEKDLQLRVHIRAQFTACGIKRVFERHRTQYRVVISPLYDQKAFSTTDKQYLCGLFGQKLVFDYSGKNEYTSSYTNYYETSHFRPQVARDILRRTYRDLEP